jgi:hypothetical protein
MHMPPLASMTNRHIASLAAGLSQAQRDVLLSNEGALTEGGIGSWLLLQRAGLLDEMFDLTPLGNKVAAALKMRSPPIEETAVEKPAMPPMQEVKKGGLW